MTIQETVKSLIRDVKDFPKPGIIFKDITPIFNDPALVREMVNKIAAQFKDKNIDAVAAIEARGFIFGSLLSQALNTRFIPIRKAGKLPYETVSQEYALEYGTAKLEMHTDAVHPGWNVLIHDDLIATGGTAAAAGDLIRNMGGTIAGFSFLINLAFLPGAQNLQHKFAVKPYNLIEY